MFRALIFLMVFAFHAIAHDPEKKLLEDLNQVPDLTAFETTIDLLSHSSFSEAVTSKALKISLSRYTSEFIHSPVSINPNSFLGLLNTYLQPLLWADQNNMTEREEYLGRLLGTYEFQPFLDWYRHQKSSKPRLAYFALLGASGFHNLSLTRKILDGSKGLVIDNEYQEILLISAIHSHATSCFHEIFEFLTPHLTNHTLHMVFIFACLNQEVEIVSNILESHRNLLSNECLISAYISSHSPYKNDKRPINKLLIPLVTNIPNLEFYPKHNVPLLQDVPPMNLILQEGKLMRVLFKDHARLYRVRSHFAPLPFYPPFMVVFDEEENQSTLKLHKLRFYKPFLKYKGKLYYQALAKNHLESKDAYEYSYHSRYGSDLSFPIHLFLIMEEDKIERSNKDKPSQKFSSLQRK